MIHPQPEETRTADEIKGGIVSKLSKMAQTQAQTQEGGE
jgi:hypothetical protein